MKQFSLLAICLLVACQAPKQPDTLLEPQKMVDILIDLHIVEAQVNDLINSSKSRDSLRLVYLSFQEKVFAKHGTDADTYYQNYDHYLQNIKQLDQVYKAVADSLLARFERAENKTIEQTPEEQEILQLIKNQAFYAGDALAIYNGKLQSNNPILQRFIAQYYNIPENYQSVRREVEATQEREMLVIYRMATEQYYNRVQKPSKQALE
ncbi:DUF4296 domain-containing protein [Eisenibacter elegans]|jgi:hypothetical protein|uniref:DUF4296 domain-containing protein n=1 Tax=Eisenibacter elegans TaxID=997 RepID=UPI0009D63E50|nr:DUF4296 domain-containing protein [Eisenibacter elegans]